MAGVHADSGRPRPLPTRCGADGVSGGLRAGPFRVGAAREELADWHSDKAEAWRLARSRSPSPSSEPRCAGTHAPGMGVIMGRAWVHSETGSGRLGSAFLGVSSALDCLATNAPTVERAAASAREKAPSPGEVAVGEWLAPGGQGSLVRPWGMVLSHAFQTLNGVSWPGALLGASLCPAPSDGPGGDASTLRSRPAGSGASHVGALVDCAPLGRSASFAD